MGTLKRFLVTLLRPEEAAGQVKTALPLASVPELPLVILAEDPSGLSGEQHPLHEATLFITLPDPRTLSPDQKLAWREALRWELEILAEAYRTLDPELEGLNWFDMKAD